MNGQQTREKYPDKIRRIVYWDQEENRKFIFFTNALDISPMQVAELYHQRWNIELFFQVVEAASEDKKVLGYYRERRKDPDLLRDNRLLYDGNCPEEKGHQTVYLRDVTDRKYLIDRYYASPRTVWST